MIMQLDTLEAFGEEYVQYKKKVCRYLGRKL